MAHILKSAEAPRLRSTRDTRDRIHLVTKDILNADDDESKLSVSPILDGPTSIVAGAERAPFSTSAGG